MEDYGIHERERERQAFGNTVIPPTSTRGIRSPYPPPQPRRIGPTSEVKKIMVTDCKTADQRVAIAIDVQNLYYGAKDIYGTKVAYQKFLDRILNGRKLVRSIAYIANRDSNNQGSFIKLMRGIGCDVRQKQVIERPNGMKCNWDVEIAVDGMSLAPRIDTFILASGDGDFTYLLRALKMQGVKTEVVAFRANTASALIDEADEYRDITRDMLIENAQAWKNKPVAKAGVEDEEVVNDADVAIVDVREKVDDESAKHNDDDDLYEEPEYPNGK